MNAMIVAAKTTATMSFDLIVATDDSHSHSYSWLVTLSVYGRLARF
jgi:hypothetical protein